MRNRRYFLDLNDLQYKQVKLPLKKRLLRLVLWIAGTVTVTIIYATIFHHFFGSPKETLLSRQIEDMRLKYSFADRKLDNSSEIINSLKRSDEIRYRAVLAMDSIPGSIRNPGFGGVERYSSLNGYNNSLLMKSMRTRIDELKNMVNVQTESFVAIKDRAEEWKFEMDHLPAISPVDPKFRLGDRFGYREVHPVLGIGRPHYGQDFYVPYGTKVYATGDGKVIAASWNSGGFGNVVVIDHGNGLHSYYAHLSKINVTAGVNVKRGDNIGLSGSSGLSSGAHLHYQINKFGRPVNAIEFFNNDVTQEEFNEMIEAFASKSRYR
jgi:murein DD-endopeptidase MepM/ murein hydrolase activator NlpD